MEKDKTPSQIVEVVSPNVVDDFGIRTEKLEKLIEEKYNAEWIETFRKLAYEITVVGMNIKEACIIAEVDYEKLVVLMQNDPLIERLIKTKDLEYKRALLKTVSSKAKTDDKQAQWLLQARYPDEFNPRKGSGGGDGGGDDLLGVAIEFIQKTGDNSPLVTEKSGKITMVKRTNAENNDVMKRIGEILK